MSGLIARRAVIAAALLLSAVAAPACIGYDRGDGIDPEDSIADDADDPSGEPEPDLDDPCACTDETCLQQWMRDHGYCDQCAVFACDTGEYHACTLCNDGEVDNGIAKSPRGDLSGELGDAP